MKINRRSLIGWSLLTVGGISLVSISAWKFASNPAFMSACTVEATEPEEHGDFRIWQPLQMFEFESEELEVNCREVQRTVDIKMNEMVPIFRPFNQQWTMASQFGKQFHDDFKAVRNKDSDPIDLSRLANFVNGYKLECRYSPVTLFPWSQEGIVKCRINNGKWMFFHSSVDDASKR